MYADRENVWIFPDVPAVNRQYKDRLFRFLFNHRKDLLELYNALNGTALRQEEELEINTLDGVIYMGMKNDISFVLGASVNLYEHQSTWNGNMPLRGFLYLSDLYQKYLTVHGYNLAGKKRIALPRPSYYIFYNGEDAVPDRMELRLSDAFEGAYAQEAQNLEFCAIMLNINRGHNEVLMGKCRKLWEYAELVGRIRDHLKSGISREAAVEAAVQSCLAEGILADVLKQFRAEVKNMLLMEYDQEATEAYLRKEAIEMGLEEGRAEGLKEGRAEGLKEGRAEGLKKGIEQGIEQGMEQGIEKGVCAFCRFTKKMRMSREEIFRELKEQFEITDEEAADYLSRFWE